MKKVILFAGLIFLASCEIYLLENPNAWDDRDQFVGSYNVEEYSQTTDHFYNYSITIYKSCCVKDEIRITNFYGADIKVTGMVFNNRITIPLQQVGGYEIEGTGKLVQGKLVMTFFARALYSYPAMTDFVEIEAWPY